MLIYTLIALIDISLLSWLFVWRLVGQPLKRLKSGTKELADGNLGYQLEVDSTDEAGELANSFNRMSLQLRSANEEIVAWARTLEDRVDQKTRELKRAHEQVLHIEKMATIGKMAAVVAHEINNPLSGILTYAKLVRKWIERGEAETTKRQDSEQCLNLIAEESRRCGDLVKNLLTFSRTAPMNRQTTDINTVVERSLRLIAPQMEMKGIDVHPDLAKELPRVQCDPGQIEQVVLALSMNALDAMPHGGNLWVTTRMRPDSSGIEIEVRDDGSGIPDDILPQIFEPFLTTKESGKSVGLGLAVSQNIIERHSGRIEVQSKAGKGATFTVTLPLDGSAFPVAASVAEVVQSKSR
jgi:two-component system NtrC family sensor kinase